MTGKLRCRAVVMRRHGVGVRLPWPHWIGAPPSEEARPDFAPETAPDHPYRREEFSRRIALTGRMDPLEVGTAVAAIALYACDEDELEVTAEGIAERLLADEGVVVGGGIEVSVDDAVVVTPQCCAGLEKWREWLEFVDRGAGSPWNGHDPMLHCTRLGSGMIAIGYEGAEEQAIAVAPEALSAALRAVEGDLAGFARLLERWARLHVPRLADALVDKLTRDLALRPPR